jgi:threonine/homoserine/homoserine lactone efflux protein
MYILEGFLIGLVTLFIIGPVLFILVNATLQNGLKSGISVAFGIFLSDLIYAILCVKGLSSLINNPFLDRYLSLIGFVILFIFGLVYALKKENIDINTIDKSNKTHFQNFLKGFSINFFNPFVLSFWILLSKHGFDSYNNKTIYFLLSLVFGILVIDIVKAFLAKRLHPLLNSKKIFFFYKISGFLMILFSFRILYHYFICISV